MQDPRRVPRQGRASTRGARGLLAASLLFALFAGRPAVAQVTQTDAIRTPLPQPVGLSELDLVNVSYAWNANTPVIRDAMGVLLDPPAKYGDVYAPPAYPQFVTGDALTLSGLFKWRKESINPVLDAKTGPGFFSAKCGFSAELVLVGGNCGAQLGWYNVLDPASKSPPAAAEVYPLIGLAHEAVQCVYGGGKLPQTDGFCPLAWDNRDPYDLSIQRWVRKTFSSGDLSKDVRYKGGYVAFALIGDPQKCSQNKYSMYEHNQRNAKGEPWVTSLIYQSSVDSRGVYIAFEDLPMSPADWRLARDNASYGADGDFNDYVVYVSRPSCPGDIDEACVGKSCPVGQTCQLGICSDACTGVACPGNEPCVNGACLAPSGVGGSGGTSATPLGGTSSIGPGSAGMPEGGEGGEDGFAPVSFGGAAGDDEGATSAAGADARGGAADDSTAQRPPKQRTSSCGYAALAPALSSRAWSMLGLALGLTFVRRRYRVVVDSDGRLRQ
jgi:hypothetical protein